jgi:TM2 domain-containing membrane protein YozV
MLTCPESSEIIRTLNLAALLKPYALTGADRILDRNGSEPREEIPMLIQCADCLRSISINADRCPHCGCPASLSRHAPPRREAGSTDDTTAPSHGEPKSKAIAAILAILCCGVGIHRYYLGHFKEGTFYLIATFVGIVTYGVAVGFLIGVITVILSLVDFCRILSGDLKDASGQPLR